MRDRQDRTPPVPSRAAPIARDGHFQDRSPPVDEPSPPRPFTTATSRTEDRPFPERGPGVARAAFRSTGAARGRRCVRFPSGAQRNARDRRGRILGPRCDRTKRGFRAPDHSPPPCPIDPRTRALRPRSLYPLPPRSVSVPARTARLDTRSCHPARTGTARSAALRDAARASVARVSAIPAPAARVPPLELREERPALRRAL